jgi:acetyl esterase
MPLDEQTSGLLAALKGAGLKSFEQMSIEEFRGAVETFVGLQKPPQEMAAVHDVMIPGPEGSRAARVYVPKGEGPFPTMVYFHGGGWVGGSIAVADEPCRALASRAGVIVVSASYRLSPENKFPAAIEDAYAAVVWTAATIEEYGGDPSRIGVIGDSAGGNLAAVAALMARDKGGPRLSAQVLTYPVIDPSPIYPSLKENGQGYVLEAAAIPWFWGHYLADPADAANPYASPIKAEDLSGLPPALIMTVEFDPARDEGEAYGAKLKAAGVPTIVTRFPGLIHATYWASGAIPRADELYAAIADFLKSRFH